MNLYIAVLFVHAIAVLVLTAGLTLEASVTLVNDVITDTEVEWHDSSSGG